MADASANAIGAWVHGLATGVAHGVVNAHNWVENQPSLQEGIASFVNGLTNGAGNQMQAQVATAAPKAAKAAAKPAGDPNAGATVTLGNGTTVTLPSAAWLKAHPATAAPQSQVGYGSANPGGAPQGGTAQPAAAAQSAPPMTNFDILRQMALGNPGMTRGDVGTVASALAQLSPTKGMTPLEAAKMQTMQQYLARNDAMTQQALAAAGNDPLTREKILTTNLTNLRPIFAPPNPVGDVNASMGFQQPGAAY